MAACFLDMSLQEELSTMPWPNVNEEGMQTLVETELQDSGSTLHMAFYCTQDNWS